MNTTCHSRAGRRAPGLAAALIYMGWQTSKVLAGIPWALCHQNRSSRKKGTLHEWVPCWGAELCPVAGPESADLTSHARIARSALVGERSLSRKEPDRGLVSVCVSTTKFTLRDLVPVALPD